MDNVAFHRNRELTNILLDKGISCIFIPPYSPRCNPIEEVFSVIKRRFRTYDYLSDFDDRVSKIVEEIKLYKDILCFYLEIM